MKLFCALLCATFYVLLTNIEAESNESPLFSLLSSSSYKSREKRSNPFVITRYTARILYQNMTLLLDCFPFCYMTGPQQYRLECELDGTDIISHFCFFCRYRHNCGRVGAIYFR